MAYYKEAVGTYHGKLKDMKIRVLKEDATAGIPDYSNIFKEQASLQGKSLNEYILDLIENDIRTNNVGLHDETFHIIRGMSEIKSIQKVANAEND